MMVPFCSAPASSLVSGESGGSELSFQSRERLEIAVEIDRRSGIILEGLVVGGGEPRFESVNPEWLSCRIPQRHGDGGQDHVLAGHFGRSHEIDRTRALRFWPLLESEYPYNQSDDCDANQHDAQRGKIALGGPEFVADVKLGGRRGLWRR